MCIATVSILTTGRSGNAVRYESCAGNSVSISHRLPNLIGSPSLRIFRNRSSGSQRVKERKMGNPAGMRLKKRLKRRKKFETRMEGMAYVSKEVRAEIKKELALADAKK